MGILDNTPISVDKAKQDDQNYFLGFAKSTLSSIPEVFGVRPPVDVESFRLSHPIGGFGSELLGSAVPYGGWFKASKLIKPLDTAINTIGDIEKAPILTRAAREAARLAPFEAGRVAVATGVNHQPLGEEVQQSAINIGLGGAFGGAIGALEAAGPMIRGKSPTEFSPKVDPSAPKQIQLRQLGEAAANGEIDPKLQLDAQNWAERTKRDIRIEEPGPTQRYLAKLDMPEDADRQVSRSLERLFFKPDRFTDYKASNKGWLVRTFSRSGPEGRGFKTDAEWMDAAQQAGLPDNWPELGQYYRFIRADTDKAAKDLAARAGKLTNVGDYSIGKEDDGLWVMLKRMGNSPDGKPVSGDRWVAFKTDTPAAFVNDPTLTSVMKHEAWLPPTDLEEGAGGNMFNFLRKSQETFKYEDYSAGRKDNMIAKLAKDKLGEFGQRANDVVTYLMTPAINQTIRNPKANYILTQARLLYDHADQTVNDAMLGPRPIGDAKSVLAAALGKAERNLDGGIAGRINEFNDTQLKQFVDLWRQGADQTKIDELYAAGHLDPIVKESYPKFEEAVTGFARSRAETAKLLGDNSFTELPGHGGLSRSWEGSLRIPLTNDSGDLVGIAAADNKAAVEKRAKFIQEKLQGEGTSSHIGSMWDTTSNATMPREFRVFMNQPGFIQARSGVRGFKWDFGDNPTKDQLISEYRQNLQNRARSEAELALHASFQSDVANLAQTDSTMFKVVTDRLNAMNGKPDEITQKINQIVDPLLSPIMGTNSASKIVQATNEGFWHLQLGAMNVGYPVMNMIGVLQTVTPEISMLMTAPPERLAGYYLPQMVRGIDGKSKGMMNFLDPVKMMGRAVGQMSKPDAGFMDIMGRALNDGTMDPRFIEDMVGENSKRIGRFKEVLQGKEPFFNWIKAVSEFMPAFSERLSRGYSLAVGYDVGHNVFGLEGDALYQFSKRFVDRTMYRYATADRPAVLTNPVGRLFGSMKNWMAHYLSNMLVYSDEALHGNVAPLAWQMASTAALGGLSSVPFLPSVANAFLAQSDDHNLMEWTYRSLGKHGGDAAYFGLPAIMGVSLASATASPTRDANMLFSFAQWSRAQSMGQAIGGAIDYWKVTGEHPGRDPRVAGLLARALAPKTFYRFAQVYDDPGIKSLSTGYPIIDQVNPWNKVLFTMGFQPNDIERGYSAFNEMNKSEEATKKRVTILGAALQQAFAANDSEGIDSVMNEATVTGVDVSSVMKSAQARMNQSDESMLQRNFDDDQQAAMQSVMETWDQQ